MYDLVVIGGGAGGLTIGKYGAKLGAKVAIIEAARLGGDCTWSGCVPSKALIASARAAHATRRRAEFGLPPAAPAAAVDLGAIVDRIHGLQERIYREHDDPDELRASGCDVIEGRARFVSAGAVEVAGRRIEARKFCVATGSQAALPPIEGLEASGYWTNETIFEQRRLPARLLVVGGGPIGLELGQAFGRLGSRVVIVEALPRILAPADPELAALLRDCLRDEGIEIRTETLVQSLDRTQGTTRARLRSAADCTDESFEAVLIATGRRPNVADLGLEMAGVEYDTGGIQVDERLRSSNPNVFAIGDVAGRHAFTHTAAYEGSIVLQNALFPLMAKADESVVPSATFTDPEVAQVGLGEEEARARWDDVRVWRQEFASSDRAVLDGEARGFVKLITRGRKHRLLGAQIIGAHAAELIHEWAVAMRAGLGANEVAQVMHVYPTLSEANRFAALQPYERWLAGPTVRRLRQTRGWAESLRQRLRALGWGR